MTTARCSFLLHQADTHNAARDPTPRAEQDACLLMHGNRCRVSECQFSSKSNLRSYREEEKGSTYIF